MSIKKKIISNIYLKNGKAVSDSSGEIVFEITPADLALKYASCHVDGLFVTLLSESDAEHELNLDMLKEICQKAEIPVIGAAPVKRMEDIKKLLYAGCKQAVLDYDVPEGVAITEEVSGKFGSEKLLVKASEIENLTANMELIESSASGVILDKPDEFKVLSFKESTSVPFYVNYISGKLDAFAMCNFSKCQVICGFKAEASKVMEFKERLVAEGMEIQCLEAALSWSDFKLNSDGMVPVIVQDYQSNEVLMMAYMNEEAFNQTLRTGKMTYYSRSRQELWLKGDTSGHYQYVKSLTADCDMDTILAKVSQIGAACHTGKKSCFFNEITSTEFESKNPTMVFQDVYDVIMDRKLHPKEGSYTNYLFDKGIDKILKKLGEEATEIVIAAKNPNANEIKYEICDFLYHMMVLMAEKDVTWDEITRELAKR